VNIGLSPGPSYEARFPALASRGLSHRTFNSIDPVYPISIYYLVVLLTFPWQMHLLQNYFAF